MIGNAECDGLGLHEIYLTPKELSERYGGRVALQTLANWRSSSAKGPESVKFAGRIYYPLSSLLEWEKKNSIE